MQDEFDAAGIDITIRAINKISAESGISSLTLDMDLPVVQDTTERAVWADWGGEWRDVFLLNEANEHVGTYNLRDHDIRDAADYAELKGMFEDLVVD